MNAIKDHVLLYEIYSNNRFKKNYFAIIRKYISEFHSEIHEALLTKNLNRQKYANEAYIERCNIFL